MDRSSVSSGWNDVPIMFPCFTATIFSSIFESTSTFFPVSMTEGALMKTPRNFGMPILFVFQKCSFQSGYQDNLKGVAPSHQLPCPLFFLIKESCLHTFPRLACQKQSFLLSFSGNR